MDVTIRGVNIPDVDMTDADFLSVFESGRKNVSDINEESYSDTSDYIRAVCRTMRAWFDNLFEAGMGDKIIPKDSLKEAIFAMADLVNAVKNSNSEILEFASTFSAQNSMSGNNRKNRRKHKRRR